MSDDITVCDGQSNSVTSRCGGRGWYETEDGDAYCTCPAAERIKQEDAEGEALRQKRVQDPKPLKTYWCRYKAPFSIPSQHIVEVWPQGMKGWRTGYSADASIWCARVDATSSDEAKDIISNCYGPSAHRITIYLVDECEYGWRPQSDRFPE